MLDVVLDLGFPSPRNIHQIERHRIQGAHSRSVNVGGRLASFGCEVQVNEKELTTLVEVIAGRDVATENSGVLIELADEADELSEGRHELGGGGRLFRVDEGGGTGGEIEKEVEFQVSSGDGGGRVRMLRGEAAEAK